MMPFTSIADRPAARRAGIGGLLLVWLLTTPAMAHPVAQGALQIRIDSDSITIQARISMEQVLVEAAYGGGADRPLAEKIRAHGDYLLARLRLRADGRPLQGTLDQVQSQPNQPEYRLHYPSPGADRARLELEQDLLREFEFAPGNPWEASYLVEVLRPDQAPLQGLLLASNQPLPLPAPAGGNSSLAIGAFVQHGIHHILTGYDHLLFVTALVLAVAGLWDLLKVITVFTLAHTLTLALSALDLVRLPATIVEPMIAASIVVIALQNLLWPAQSRGRQRLWVAFGFGLFHGLGFAGGLLEAAANLGQGQILLAIAAFSLGVEIGHQLVVIPAYLGRRLLQNSRHPGLDLQLRRYASAAISVAGMLYLWAALRA